MCKSKWYVKEEMKYKSLCSREWKRKGEEETENEDNRTVTYVPLQYSPPSDEGGGT